MTQGEIEVIRQEIELWRAHQTDERVKQHAWGSAGGASSIRSTAAISHSRSPSSKPRSGVHITRMETMATEQEIDVAEAAISTINERTAFVSYDDMLRAFAQAAIEAVDRYRRPVTICDNRAYCPTGQNAL